MLIRVNDQVVIDIWGIFLDLLKYQQMYKVLKTLPLPVQN